MLKREITYEDFNGEKCTDTFYFNISKPELVEFNVEFEGGLKGMVEKIIEAKDEKTVISLFKRIILLAYGQKSEDGKRFVKSDQLREEFSQHAAYYELFMEVATNDSKAAEFLTGSLPKDLVSEMDMSSITSTANTTAPKPPTTPAA